MPVALSVALVISWLVIFVGLFLFENLQSRFARLSVEHQHLLRMQIAILDHFGIDIPEDALTRNLRTLVMDGKTLEAIASYRNVRGVGYKEAKAYIDSLAE
jgi:hypothetical protein